MTDMLPGVDRRTFIGGTGAVVVGLVTSGAVVARAEAGPARYRPVPVVEWALVGGFVAPAFVVLRPARLVAYPDGVAIADADRTLRLSRAELDVVRRHAANVLGNPANLRRRRGAPIIADAPATLFRASAPDGRRYRAQVEALEESRADRAYPRPLYGLLDRLTGVHGRVVTSGQPYRPDAVLLVVVGADPDPGTVPAWPDGVPVPALDGPLPYGLARLRGAVARRLVNAIPQGDPWQWPAFRTPDGRVLRAAWRRLLPHE
jgi:hypothetical protein